MTQFSFIASGEAFNIDSWRSEWGIEDEIHLIGLVDIFQNRRELLGNLKNCAFLFEILFFSPNFMAQFAKELSLQICFPYLICLTFRGKNI